jgi:glycosyltransferase involved in cell wall biosynthesis
MPSLNNSDPQGQHIKDLLDPYTSGAANGRLMVVSYDSGVSGYVTSEWLDDKLRSIESLGIRPTLVTRPESKLETSNKLRVIRPQSLGWRDYLIESKGRPLSIAGTLSFLVSASLGRVFDFVFEKLAGSYSYGKWSWIFLAFPAALFAAVRNGSRIIFTTGGPSSAHFVGLLVKMCLPKIRLYVELQDPFIGSEMMLTPNSRRVLFYLERILVKGANKVVFVTEAAAQRARARFTGEHLKRKIVAIYPGSWDFQVKLPAKDLSHENQVTFMHVGSLYTTRGLELFFRALDRLRESGFDLAEKVRIVNQGDLNVDANNLYLDRSDFKLWSLVGRQEALAKAASADFLLLVQHSDSRSEETIPYKTYDYLNLGVPIFGLTNNPELDSLISMSGGFVGSSTDLDKTIAALRTAIMSMKTTGPETAKVSIDINRQFAKIFE